MLEYRKGIDNEHTDALSRRDQDKRKDGDHRLLCRYRQVLKPVSVGITETGRIELAESHEIFAYEDF